MKRLLDVHVKNTSESAAEVVFTFLDEGRNKHKVALPVVENMGEKELANKAMLFARFLNNGYLGEEGDAKKASLPSSLN